MRVRNVTVSFLAAATILLAETAQERLKKASVVFTEIMGTPEKGIPEELLGKANCINVISGVPNDHAHLSVFSALEESYHSAPCGSVRPPPVRDH